MGSHAQLYKGKIRKPCTLNSNILSYPQLGLFALAILCTKSYNNIMKKTYIISFLLLTLVAWFTMYYSNKVQDKAFAEFDRYEACVLQEYGTTPASFREEHGFLPEC